MLRSRFRLSLGLSIVSCLAVSFASASAEAHRNGIASEGCTGCHSGGTTPMVTITSSPAMISPGQTVTFAVAIATTESYAGLFMTTDVGTLASLAGQGTQLIAGGITHTAPKKVVNGVATFQVGWTAPGSPGGVNVQAWVLAANGDGTPNGDGPGMAFEAFTFGCSGTMFYRDFDGDGYAGPQSGYTRGCSVPVGYALVQGDCDDNDASIHLRRAGDLQPSRRQLQRPHRRGSARFMTYYLDNTGTAPPGSPPSVVDCAPPPGYCALASCGTGWCRRLASSCGIDDCTPGNPRSRDLQRLRRRLRWRH